MTQQVESSEEQGLAVIRHSGDPKVMHQWSPHSDMDSTIKHGMETSGAHQQLCAVILEKKERRQRQICDLGVKSCYCGQRLKCI